MSKKLLIIFIGVIVIAGIAIVLFIGNLGERGEGNRISVRNFLPFGEFSKSGERQNENVDGENNNTEAQNNEIEVKFWEVTNFPISGYSFSLAPRAKSAVVQNTETPLTKNPNAVDPSNVENVPALVYMEQSTGNIHQYYIDTKKERRLTNTTALKSYESVFGNGGKSLMIRMLDNSEKNIQTYFSNIPTPAITEEMTPGRLIGSFIENNISDLSVSKNSKKFLSIIETSTGSVWKVGDMATGKSNQVFVSPLSEWVAQWINDNSIMATTKASAFSEGFMFELNLKAKSFNKVLGNISGLTTLASPDGTKILYSSAENGGVSLYLFDTKSGLKRDLEVSTLPEKCVWSKTSFYFYCAVPIEVPRGAYPDDWYMGTIAFADSIMKISTVGTKEILVDIESTIGQLDAIKLSLDDNEEYLSLINKRDSHLWVLDLK